MKEEAISVMTWKASNRCKRAGIQAAIGCLEESWMLGWSGLLLHRLYPWVLK